MGWSNGFGEVTAEDVKYSYERMANPEMKSPYRGDWAALDKVEVTSSHTGMIVLKEPYIPLFTTTMPFNSSSIVCKAAMMKLEGQRYTVEPPATFGAYKIKSIVPRQRYVLERNRDWPGPPVAFDEVEYINILDANAAETAYAAGEIDLTLLPMTAVPRVQKSMPAKSKLVTAPSLAYWWLGMQMEEGLFADKRVRQAVQLAVDVNAVLEGAFFGVAPRSTGFIAPGMIGHRAANKIAKPDLAAARKLLADAGHPRGFKAEIGVRNSAEFVNAAQVVAASLAQIGIEAQIQPFDQGVQKAMAGNDWKKMQIHITRFSMQPDPSWASVWFTKEQIGEWNWERFPDAEYNDLHAKALREPDPQKRHAMYVRMQDIMEDSGAYVFLTHGINPILHRDHFIPALTPDANRVLVTKSATPERGGSTPRDAGPRGDPGMVSVAAAAAGEESRGASALRRLLRDPLGAFGLALVALIVASALFADVLAAYQPTQLDIRSRLPEPTALHWFGTDQLGRDMSFARHLGRRIALLVSRSRSGSR